MNGPGLLGDVLFASGLGLGAAIQPGPLQALLVSRVVAVGWKRTLPACFAPLLSDGPVALLAILALGRLPRAGLPLLRAAGGVLLLYLAWTALGQWRRPAAASSQPSAPRTLLEAATLNLLNPNPYLAWALVLGPAVVAAWRRHPLEAAAFVAALYGTMLLTMVAFVLLAGSSRLLSPRVQHALVFASAAILSGLGLLLLVEGLRGVEYPYPALRCQTRYLGVRGGMKARPAGAGLPVAAGAAPAAHRSRRPAWRRSSSSSPAGRC